MTHTIKDETIYLNDEFIIEKIVKNIKSLKLKLANKENDSSSDTLFKDLTFNVNLNSDDLEAKKNLVLPYELIGYGLEKYLNKKIFFFPF